jgi:hypothetical protein
MYSHQPKSRDSSTTLRAVTDDYKARQARLDLWPRAAWARLRAGLEPAPAHDPHRRRQPGADCSPEGPAAGEDVQSATGDPLELVPEVLRGAGLPDGVVEIVIADAKPPERCMLDIQAGRVSVVALGSAVPWTSISGTGGAWALALGPKGDVSQLRHTGEPRLGERVIAALGAQRELLDGPTSYSALDCR